MYTVLALGLFVVSLACLVLSLLPADRDKCRTWRQTAEGAMADRDQWRTAYYAAADERDRWQQAAGAAETRAAVAEAELATATSEREEARADLARRAMEAEARAGQLGEWMRNGLKLLGK